MLAIDVQFAIRATGFRQVTTPNWNNLPPLFTVLPVAERLVSQARSSAWSSEQGTELQILGFLRRR
jgi:hypothetical protein